MGMFIELQNIQCYVHVRFDLPDTGLVQIIGDNSNGKSVLGKVIAEIAKLSVLHQEDRDPLIRDGCSTGKVTFGYKGKILTVLLSRDRNECYYSLTREDGSEITRTFREGGLQELLHEFGLRTYGKGSVVLQLHETFGIIPFVSGSDATNFEIVDEVSTDTVAKQFIQNFREKTYVTAKKLLEHAKQQKEINEAVVSSLVLYDVDAYEKMKEWEVRLYDILDALYPIHLDEITVLPDIDFIDYEPTGLWELKTIPPVDFIDYTPSGLTLLKLYPYVDFAEISPSGLEDISKDIVDLQEAYAGRCPTCGRLFIEGCEEVSLC